MLPNNLTWQYGYVNSSGGWSEDSSHKNAFSDYIYLKAGTYTISYEIATTIISIAKYNTSKVFIERDQTIYAPNTSKNKTFTLNQDSYIRVSHYDDTGLQILDNINSEKNQIEIGSTATEYVPHQEQNYPFTFAEGQRGMQGTTLEDDGIHQNRNRVNLWEQTIVNGMAFGNYYRYQINISDAKTYSTNDGSTALCNCFYRDIDALSSANAKVGMFAQFRDTQGFYFISDKSTTTEFIAELTENNAVLEYELAESELENNIIPYNSTQQAQYNAIKQARSYDDITYITSTSDELGFDMNVVAVADANKVIDSLDTRLLALESEV